VLYISEGNEGRSLGHKSDGNFFWRRGEIDGGKEIDNFVSAIEGCSLVHKSGEKLFSRKSELDGSKVPFDEGESVFITATSGGIEGCTLATDSSRKSVWRTGELDGGKLSFDEGESVTVTSKDIEGYTLGKKLFWTRGEISPSEGGRVFIIAISGDIERFPLLVGSL